MFRNLNAEMARYEIDLRQMSVLTGIAPKTLRNKLSGATEFKYSEITAVLKAFPVKFSVEYLFDSETSA